MTLFYILVPLNIIVIAIYSFKKTLPIMFGPWLYAGGQLLIAMAVWF